MLEILNTIVTTILLYGFYAFLAVFAIMAAFCVLLVSLPFILLGLTILFPLLILSGEGLWALVLLFPIFMIYLFGEEAFKDDNPHALPNWPDKKHEREAKIKRDKILRGELPAPVVREAPSFACWSKRHG